MEIAYIENESQLKPVLALCYDILGHHLKEIDYYSYEAWKERIESYSRLLVYARVNGEIVAAVLGRPENNDSLVMGFTACVLGSRMKGITKALVERFENNAKEMNFKRITLGADKDAEGFYEKCGYTVCDEMHGQKIYRKEL